MRMRARKIAAIILGLMMVLNSIPFTSFAEDPASDKQDVIQKQSESLQLFASEDELDQTEEILTDKQVVTADHVTVTAKDAQEFYDILGIKKDAEEKLVSSDIIGMKFGSLFDANQTMVSKMEDGNSLVQVVSWYDNENSYTSQMVRTIKYLAELK